MSSTSWIRENPSTPNSHTYPIDPWPCCPAFSSREECRPQSFSSFSGSVSATENLFTPDHTLPRQPTALAEGGTHWVRLQWAAFTAALLAMLAKDFQDMRHGSSSLARSCFWFLLITGVGSDEHLVPEALAQHLFLESPGTAITYFSLFMRLQPNDQPGK